MILHYGKGASNKSSINLSFIDSVCISLTDRGRYSTLSPVQRAVVITRRSRQVQTSAEGLGGESPAVRVLAGPRLTVCAFPLSQLQR